MKFTPVEMCNTFTRDKNWRGVCKYVLWGGVEESIIQLRFIRDCVSMTHLSSMRMSRFS